MVAAAGLYGGEPCVHPGGSQCRALCLGRTERMETWMRKVAQQGSAQKQGARPQPGHRELGQDKVLVLEGWAVQEWFLHQLRWTFGRLFTNQLDF